MNFESCRITFENITGLSVEFPLIWKIPGDGQASRKSSHRGTEQPLLPHNGGWDEIAATVQVHSLHTSHRTSITGNGSQAVNRSEEYDLVKSLFPNPSEMCSYQRAAIYP